LIKRLITALTFTNLHYFSNFFSLLSASSPDVVVNFRVKQVTMLQAKHEKLEKPSTFFF